MDDLVFYYEVYLFGVVGDVFEFIIYFYVFFGFVFCYKNRFIWFFYL